jgi:transcriptional regulator NrdR family protein
MTCPDCGSEKTRVYATRKGFVTKRFRECMACGFPFITKEVVDDNLLTLEYNDYLEKIDTLPAKLRWRAKVNG